MKKTFLLFAALALVAFGAQAQTPEYVAKMKKMIELSGTDAVLKEMPGQVVGMMQKQMNGALPDSVSGQIEALIAESFPKLIDSMTPVYARYYTEEDLDGLIAFYESPLGKKLASTQPMIAKEMLAVMPSWAAEFGQKLSVIMQAAKKQTTGSQTEGEQ